MANDKGQTTGSVLFKSLADGLQGLQQGMEQKRQNDLQNLMMAMKVQDAEMNREAFLQSQQLREQQLQNAKQTFKKGQLELGRLADPVGTARREAEAQAEAQRIAQEQFVLNNLPQDLPGLNILQGVGVENNLQPLNSQDVSQMGYEALSRIRPTMPPGSELETPFGKISVPREDQLALAGLRGEKTETEKVKREKTIAEIDVLSEKLQTESLNRGKIIAQTEKIQTEINQMSDPVIKELNQAKLDKLKSEIQAIDALKELRNTKAEFIASGGQTPAQKEASERRARTQEGKKILNEANQLFRDTFKPNVYDEIGIGGINNEEDLSRLVVFLNKTGGTIEERFSLIPDKKQPEVIKRFTDYFDNMQKIKAGDTSVGLSPVISTDVPLENLDDNAFNNLIDTLGIGG